MQGPSTDIILYFIKYIFTYALLFVIVPRFVFIYDKEDITKSIVANYVKMMFWVIVFGYITILLRLFEGITLVAILIISIAYKYYKLKIASGNIRKDMKDILNILFINHIERIERIERKLLQLFDEKTERANVIISNYFGDGWAVIRTLLIALLLAYSGYLYLFSTFTNIAPAASETFTSLLWMKHIAYRILFAGDIYPQGFYIFLETLHKFALMDQVYIVNFAGPVNSLMIALGMYFFISRTIKSKIGGIFSVIIYGMLGSMFITVMPSLVAANPQQFAFVFIFPVLYFYYDFINNSRWEDFLVASLGATVIGLIHPLAFVFLGVGLISLLFANIIRDAKNKFYKVFEVFVIMLISAILSIMPMAIGFLMGKPFNTASLNMIYTYLDEVKMPELRIFDYIAIVSMLLVFISLIPAFKNKKLFIAKLWILIFSVISFSAYYYGALFTNSSYLVESASTLWSLLIPIIVSFGIVVILDIFGLIIKGRLIGYSIAIATIASILTYLPQAPIIPQKVEHSSTVEQYLKISKTFRPTQWMIISWQEGYTLAFGNGFHMNISDFINIYNPEEEKLVDYTVEPNKVLKTEDIFIFYEKNIFSSNTDVESEEYQAKLEENIRLSQWIEKYQSTHSNISLYSSDDDIEIWKIHQELDKEDMKRRIWQGE